MRIFVPYVGFAIANFSLISLTNYVSCIKDGLDDHNKRWKKSKPIDRCLSLFDFVFVDLWGGLFLSGMKGSAFGIGGPIGTYRIWLAHHNKKVTGDEKWTNYIYQPSVYFDSKYITYPFGNASWIPLKKQS